MFRESCGCHFTKDGHLELHGSLSIETPAAAVGPQLWSGPVWKE